MPEADGVVVLYGLNGKGKTSFLNGIRWAWTGVARRRGNRAVEPAKLVNRDAVDAATGPVVCLVQITFDADDARWELTRSLTKDGDQLTPALTLLRNGVALTTSDAEKRVAELMPPEIEQFFLFDGELLDQYEKLVDDDGIAGSPLRDSIERILGVPVVRNAARDMRALAEEAGKKIADAAKRERATRELGQALQTAQDLAKAHRENAEREDALITQLEGEFRDVEERLAEQQNKLELLSQRDAKRAERDRLQTRLSESRDCFAAALVAGAWKAVLVDPVTERVTALETELETDRALLNDAIVAARITEALQAAGGHTCPVCANELDDEHAAHLRTFVGDVDPAAARNLADRVTTATERLKTLRRVVDDGARAQLRELENDFRRAEVDVHDAEDDLKQLQEQLSETSENALTDLVTQSRNLALKLERAETYRDENTRYQEQRATIDRRRRNSPAPAAPSTRRSAAARSLRRASRRCSTRPSPSTASV